MKLQKRFAYKYKDKDHFKYVVTIPSETIGKLDWEPDTDLSVTVENESIVLTPAENEGASQKRIGTTKSKLRRGVKQ